MIRSGAEEMRNGEGFLRALRAESGRNRIVLRTCTGKTVREETAGRVDDAVRAYASALSARGLTEDRIGILGPNCREWLAAFLAVFSLGATAVLLDSKETAEDLARDIRQTGLRAVCCHPDCMDTLKGISAETGILCVPFPVWGEGKRDLPPLRKNPRGPEDPACIFFTSGTGSRKKAVIHSNRSLLAGFCNRIVKRPFSQQLVTLPLHHLAGLCGVLNAWYLGAAVALGTEMKHFFRYLEVFQPDYLTVVPVMLPILVRRLTDATPHGASLGWNLHMINCGGASFPPETLAALRRLDITVMNSYGATETGGIGFTWELDPSRPDTVGRTLPGVEAEISGGELLIRTPSMMSGYDGDPEATRAAMEDGWYHTGDGARKDAEGYFYIEGRLDSLIVLSNGENINPERLEEKLNALASVRESLVKEEEGRLTAVIVPEAEAENERVTEEIEALNEELPSAWRIGRLHLQRTPLLRNAMGKLPRRK